MNTNYDDEATQYQEAQNEETQFEGEQPIQNESEDTSAPDNSPSVKSKKGWKEPVIGAGSGLLIGGVAGVLMSMKSGDNHSDNIVEPVKPIEPKPDQPAWVDDQIQVATSVNDDMSFGQAFAAARAEVGAGGCFEWHGNVYGTYTAEEWNNMSAEQRAEYGNHFKWNNLDHSHSDVVQHSAQHGSSTAQSETGQEHAVEDNDNDIDVISVEHTNTQDETQNGPYEPIISNDSEVQILGVTHDDSTGANYAGVAVGGQEAILVDVDGDQVFDYMAIDTNANGAVDDGEIIDIQGQSLSVSDLGGFSNPSDDMLAFHNEVDYSANAGYEG